MSNQPQPPAEELLIGGPERPAKGGRRAYLLGGALAVLAIGGGAATWAAVSFFGTGPQPAEALPATTLGYVSVDLDPSGSQKIEAMKLARKFPAFKEQVGLDTEGDLRRWIVEQFADETGCELDFARDVEPWLGSRAAMAAIEGEDEPFGVVVLQTTDADKAEAGLRTLAECEGGEAGWQVEGDWVVVAETQEQADATVEAAERGTLADDAGFQEWTERVGDSGLLTAYAGPGVGDLLADTLVADFDEVAGDAVLPGCENLASAYEENVRALSAFDGAAATLRFSDGGVELRAIADASFQAALGVEVMSAADVDNSAVTSLPADTALAYGVAIPENWDTMLANSLAGLCGEGVDPETFSAELAEMVGFDVVTELPRLLGESAVIALGGDLDVEALMNDADLDGLPLAIKTTGEKAAIEYLVAGLTSSFGMPADLVAVREGEDGVAVALDPDYAEQVAGNGELGQDEVFRDLVPNAQDASFVSYLNLDRLRPAIEQLAGGDEETLDNIAPLTGVGLSVWGEKDESHALLRLSVD